MGRLVMGLDIGITSVGYGVIDIDDNKFVDYGVDRWYWFNDKIKWIDNLILLIGV